MNRDEKIKLTVQSANIFTPGAPIDRQALFAGRTSQVRDVINSIFQRGQHIILYGERGVGKTSLANVLSESLSSAGLQSSESNTIINCDARDNYSSLWHKIFREISFTVKTKSPSFKPEVRDETVSLSGLLSQEVAPDDIRHLLHYFPIPDFIIIDELDRLRDQETTTLIADTIKNLSDHSVKTTLILVGVADCVDDLIAEHQSIERCLTQVHMPRMSRDELMEILDNGLNQLDMSMEESVKASIASLSQGLPHYTHLLGLYATQEAIEDGRLDVNKDDLQTAIYRGVDKAQQSIRNFHHKATSSARKTIYTEVLLACALAPTDDLGYFAAADVRKPLSKIMDKSYDIPHFARHLSDFCEDARGPVLQKSGSARRFRFRFINPLMQPFVILDGMAKGIIRAEII